MQNNNDVTHSMNQKSTAYNVPFQLDSFQPKTIF